MKPIPNERAVINTTWTLDEAITSIHRAIDPKTRNDLERSITRFTGEVSSSGFKIRRMIKYSNAFLPVICGNFNVYQDKVRVEIKITVAPSTAAFIVIWYFFALYVLISTGFTWFNEGIFETGFLFGLCMIPFMYLVTLFWWMLEIRKARHFVNNLFAAHS